jgi:Proprotein convertase P-domain
VKSFVTCGSVLFGFSLLLGSMGCAADTQPENGDLQQSSEIQRSRPQRADCVDSAVCGVGAICDGKPSDGSGSVGKCHAEAVAVGDGDSCTKESSCKAGLRCNGLSMGVEGTCRPDWMTAVYTQVAKTASSSVVAYGLATVPEDVVVRAKLSAANLANATVTLTDPNGQVATLCSPAVPCVAKQLAAGVSAQGISRDDEVNGRWTLRVASKNNAVKIQSWSLTLSSRFD